MDDSMVTPPSTRHAHSLIKCVEAPKYISNVTGAHETGSQVMRK